MSAFQSEGIGITKAGKSEFDLTFEQRPETFFGQAGPAMGVDSMRHFKEDLALMAKYGHNSFRNSFSWVRLFPDGKNSDPKAVSYYHDYLREAKKNGLRRIMSLVHFDLPAVFSKNGFLDPSYPRKFKEYAEFIFSEYGNEVEIFVTYNEPNAQLMKGYLTGTGWPFIKDVQSYIDASVVLAYSHALAVNVFNEKYKGKTMAQISFVQIYMPVIAKDGKAITEQDKRAAEDVDALYNLLLLDPMVLGKFQPELIRTLERNGLKLNVSEEQKKEIAKVKLDCLGVNYYFVVRVEAPDPKADSGLEKIRSPYVWKKARVNPFRGWEMLPEAFLWIGRIMKTRYGNIPYWIAENGMAVQEEWRFMDKDGVVDDKYRISFVSEHLAQIHKSIQNGSNCIGYHMWSTYDCWSMLNGYKNTYGFFRVDISTMRRFPKKSAIWFSEVLKNNGIPDAFPRVEETIDLKASNAIPSESSGLVRPQKPE